MPIYTPPDPIVVRPQTANQKLRMKKRNTAFAKLPREKQRVQIAKDVLVSLKLGEFVAGSKYLTFGNIYKNRSSDKVTAAPTTDLSHVLEKATCTVCGIGSLFCSAVKRADNLPFSGVSDFRGAVSMDRMRVIGYLAPYFTSEELGEIEFYFECSNTGHAEAMYNLAISKEWDDKTPRARMSAIMRNIIKNKGAFVPDPMWLTKGCR